MNGYQEYALDGASAVDLVVALYDGIVRFLYQACEAVDRGDEGGRRAAVKRALDIIIHLQARLRMDVGGSPAEALSEFYAATFAQILQGSQAASRAKFENAIACVRNVREAWRQVAQDGTINPAPAQMLMPPRREDNAYAAEAGQMRWNA
ncbi:MAG TPA: flagellar export chaperone FliS [Terracidiphilus sp.]